MLADLKEGANNLHAKSAYVDHLKKLCKLDIEKDRKHLVRIDEHHTSIDLDKTVVENGNLPEAENEAEHLAECNLRLHGGLGPKKRHAQM